MAKAIIELKPDGPLSYVEDGKLRFIKGIPQTITNQKLIDWAKTIGFLKVMMVDDEPKPQISEMVKLPKETEKDEPIPKIEDLKVEQKQIAESKEKTEKIRELVKKQVKKPADSPTKKPTKKSVKKPKKTTKK